MRRNYKKNKKRGPSPKPNNQPAKPKDVAAKDGSTKSVQDSTNENINIPTAISSVSVPNPQLPQTETATQENIPTPTISPPKEMAHDTSEQPKQNPMPEHSNTNTQKRKKNKNKNKNNQQAQPEIKAQTPPVEPVTGPPAEIEKALSQSEEAQPKAVVATTTTTQQQEPNKNNKNKKNNNKNTANNPQETDSSKIETLESSSVPEVDTETPSTASAIAPESGELPPLTVINTMAPTITQKKSKPNNKKNKNANQKAEPSSPDSNKSDQQAEFTSKPYTVAEANYSATVPGLKELHDTLTLQIEQDVEEFEKQLTEQHPEPVEAEKIADIIDKMRSGEEGMVEIEKKDELIHISVEKYHEEAPPKAQLEENEPIPENPDDGNVQNEEVIVVEAEPVPPQNPELPEMAVQEYEINPPAADAFQPPAINSESSESGFDLNTSSSIEVCDSAEVSQEKPPAPELPKSYAPIDYKPDTSTSLDECDDDDLIQTIEPNENYFNEPVIVELQPELVNEMRIEEINEVVEVPLNEVTDESIEVLTESCSDESKTPTTVHENIPGAESNTSSDDNSVHSKLSDEILENAQLVEIPLDMSILSASSLDSDKQSSNGDSPNKSMKSSPKNVKRSDPASSLESSPQDKDVRSLPIETEQPKQTIDSRDTKLPSPSKCKQHKETKNMQSVKSKDEKADQDIVESVNFPGETLVNLLETKMTISDNTNLQSGNQNSANKPIRPERTKTKTQPQSPQSPPSSAEKAKPKKAVRTPPPIPPPPEIPIDANADMDDDEDYDYEEEDYIEFNFTPRPVFLCTACNLCKQKVVVHCPNCQMIGYCTEDHLKKDADKHRALCGAIQIIANKRSGHIYNGAYILSSEEFRSLRVHTLKKCEDILNRPLEPFERDIILFPRICVDPTCREWQPHLLSDCQQCGLVAYCTKDEHLASNHNKTMCKDYNSFKTLVTYQMAQGLIEPPLPNRVFTRQYKLTDNNNMSLCIEDLYKITNPSMYNKLTGNPYLYALTTQMATVPLTALLAAQQSIEKIDKSYTIHLIGSELAFEASNLNKWEHFFLHLVPQLTELRIVFIGPELNVANLPLQILSRIRMCRTCRPQGRGIKFDFHCGKLYHEYVKSAAFIHPNLICFFNPGLYRTTAFNSTDTWPATIKAATALFCPIVITSYTEIEIGKDLDRLEKETCRGFDLRQAPVSNPFASQRPDRSFISDDITPMIFKNLYYFLIN